MEARYCSSIPYEIHSKGLFNLLIFSMLIFSDKRCVQSEEISFLLQPSVRTRRSNGPQAEESKTLNGILKTFSNGTNAKNITKKIGPDIVQILIGHAFLVITISLFLLSHSPSFSRLLVPTLINLSSGSAHIL